MRIFNKYKKFFEIAELYKCIYYLNNIETGEMQIIDDIFKFFMNEMKNIRDKNKDEISLLEWNWLEFWVKIIDHKDY